VKKSYWIGIFLASSLAAMIFVNGSASYEGPVSEHFDGTRFFHPETDYTFSEMVKWMWTMNPAEWPEWIEDPAWPAPPERVTTGDIRITHINHGTMLIQTDGLNILTDPIWSERSSMVSWAGPKRVRAPGVSQSDLPRIDVILISHNHYDHLDLATLKQLAAIHEPIILVGLGVKKLLESQGIENVTEMDWWQVYHSLPNDLEIVFVPARHNSGRGLFDKNKTLWGGFVIESSSGLIYFSGDSAYGEFLADIKERFGQFRVALLAIGHYEPRWMMKTHHMNPGDAVKLHQLMNVQQSVGMHFGTFGGHNDEAVDAHEKDLLVALRKHDVPKSEFWLLGFGEGRDIPQ